MKELDLSFIGSGPVDDDTTPLDRGDNLPEGTTLEDGEGDLTPEGKNEDKTEGETEGETAEKPAGEPEKSEDKTEDKTEGETTKKAPEKEPEVEADKPKAPKTIPKTRFDEVNERMQRAEAELKALKAQRAALPNSTLPDFDFDAAEQKYADAVIAGQMEDAKRLRGEIRAAERATAEALVADKAMATYEGVAARASIDAAVAVVNVEYPVYDPKSPTYDQALVDEALDLFNGMIQGGKFTPAEALVRAARATAALKGIAKSTVDAESAPGRVAAKPSTDSTGSLEGKLRAAEHQPPQLSHAGRNHSSATRGEVAKLSEKDWDSLSDVEIARLRGDFL